MRFEIVETVVRVNERMKQRAADKVFAALGGDPSGKTVALLGLSFKPGTDDMRESPTLPIVHRLVEAGVTVRAFDPVSAGKARKVLPDGVVYCEDAYDAASDASVLVLATEWNEFRSLDLERVRKVMASPVVVDLRNVYDPQKMLERGFVYSGLGRGTAQVAGTVEAVRLET